MLHCFNDPMRRSVPAWPGYPQRLRWRGHVHDVARVEGPERIAPEWWRERSAARLRNYYRI